jgi:uncharacterized protein with PIN domain
MKRITSLLGSIVAAASALAIMIAAVNTTAASSQKGAERLVTLTKSSRAMSSAAAPAAAVATVHRCPTCTDALVQIVDKATKGPNHLVRNLARHNCSTCGTELVTNGSGKAAATVAMHSCGASEDANCCAMN